MKNVVKPKTRFAGALVCGAFGLVVNLIPVPFPAGGNATLRLGLLGPVVASALFGPWWGLAAGLIAGAGLIGAPAWIVVVLFAIVAVGIIVQRGFFAIPVSALFWSTVGIGAAYSLAGADWHAVAYGWMLSGCIAGAAADVLLVFPSIGMRYGGREKIPDVSSHLGPALTTAAVGPLLLLGLILGKDSFGGVMAVAGLAAAVSIVGAYVLGKRVTEPVDDALSQALAGSIDERQPNPYLDLNEFYVIRRRVGALRQELVEKIESLALRLAEREAAYSELLKLSESLEERLQLRGMEVEQREFLLSLSQRHYREVVEQASDIIFELDLHGRFTTINAAGEKFYGHGLPYLIGRFWHETLAPGYEPGGAEGSGFREILETLNQKGRYESRAIHEAGGGELRLLETRLELIQDEQGMPTGASGISRDVTEKEGFQREIQELGRTVVRQKFGLMRRERELNALLSASRAINSELEIDQLLQHIIESGAAQIKAESGFVGLLDEDALQLSWYWRSTGASWVDLENFRVEAGVTKIVLRDRQPYFCANAADDPNTDKEFTARFGVKSLLVLPIFSQSSLVIGAMALHNFPITEQVDEGVGDIGIEPKDMRFLEGLADLASAAIQQARLFEKVRQQAETDALTGLYNRRAFDTRVASEIERAVRFKRTFALVLIDIDHLKKINDTYGHQIGDAAICTVADVLQSRLRRHDFAARIGGEEFAVLLIEVKPEMAYNVAKSLLDGIRRRDVPRIGSMTASLGIAMFPDDSPIREELFRKADEALYHAKNTGRDRVTMFKKIDTGDLGSPS